MIARPNYLVLDEKITSEMMIWRLINDPRLYETCLEHWMIPRSICTMGSCGNWILSLPIILR